MALTERQSALLTHLQTLEGGVSTQYEVACRLADFYPYSGSQAAFHNSAARLSMTRDIRAINNDAEVNAIIISSGRGVKLATEEEFGKYISRQYAAVFRRLDRVRRKDAKAMANRQLKFLPSGETAVVLPFGEIRRERGLKASEVVARMKEVDARFDAPLLSRIENGVCLPTAEQAAALKVLYDKGE